MGCVRNVGRRSSELKDFLKLIIIVFYLQRYIQLS